MVSQRLFGATALALALAGLAGCKVGPDYKTPASPRAASFTTSAATASLANQPVANKPVASQPVAEAINPDWWNLFKDPELSHLESQVAAANLDVATATIRVAESRSQQKIVSSAELPAINGDASVSTQRISPRGVFSMFPSGGNQNGATGVGAGGLSLAPFTLYQYGFDASWELDLWGKVRRGTEAAAAQHEAAEYDRRDALLSALAEVARDYIDLRGVQADLRLAQRNLALSKQKLVLINQRAGAGLSSQIDVDNATADVGNAEAQIPTLLDHQAQMINRLSFLLGETPGALAPELSDARPVPPVPPRVPVGVPSELAQRRPDIRAASANLHAATAAIGMAKADFYPSISLTGSLDLQALKLKDLGNWGARTFAAGPTLSLPIFEGGKLVAQLHLREQEQQEAAVNYQRTVLSAWHEVDNALNSYRAEQTRRDQLQKSLAAQQKSVKLAQSEFDQGLIDGIDLMNAQQQLVAAQQQFDDSTTNVSTNLVSLYKALGGGWEANGPHKG